jgi:hypothetical protein
MKQPTKRPLKLEFARETIRALDDKTLTKVNGGGNGGDEIKTQGSCLM